MSRAQMILCNGRLRVDAQPMWRDSGRGYVYVALTLEEALSYAARSIMNEGLGYARRGSAVLACVFRLHVPASLLLPDVDERRIDKMWGPAAAHHAEISRRVAGDVSLDSVAAFTLFNTLAVDIRLSRAVAEDSLRWIPVHIGFNDPLAV